MVYQKSQPKKKHKKQETSGISNVLDCVINIKQPNSESAATIWGIGLCYEYDEVSGRISIIHGRHYQPITDIHLDIDEAITPKDFIRFIERTTTIQALLLSNNATCDITEIMPVERLKPYLEHVTDLAWMAALLDYMHYDAFAATICAEFQLQALVITNLNKGVSSNAFYRVSLKTQRENVISCEGFHVRNGLSMLSQKIISDLLVLETGNNFQADAQRLLKLSSDLSMLSLVLDESFIPRRKIKHAQLQKQAKIA